MLNIHLQSPWGEGGGALSEMMGVFKVHVVDYVNRNFTCIGDFSSMLKGARCTGQ